MSSLNSEKRRRRIITLCNCQVPFRGANFTKHLSKVPAAEKAKHFEVHRLYYCTKCDEKGGNNEPFFMHDSCQIDRLSKAEMVSLLTGKAPTPPVSEEVELAAAVASIQAPPEMEVKLVDDSDSSVDFVAMKRPSVRVDLDADSSTASSLPASPRGKSTPKELPPPPPSKQLRLDAGPVNATIANNRLADRNRRLIAQLKRASNEIAHLKTRRAEQEKNDRERSAHLSQLEGEVEQLRREKEEAVKKAEDAEREREEAAALFSVERKAWELERKGLDKERRREQRRTYELHVPIRDNQVVDQPLMVENLDATYECYEAPEHGITCLHGSLEAVQVSRLSFRRHRKRLASKSHFYF